MSSAKRILVTAAGGDLGQAIVKALKISSQEYTIYGCDRTYNPVGELLVTKLVIVPSANEPDYHEKLASLAEELKIDAIIPASEFEIRAVTKKWPDRKIKTKSGGVIYLICQSPKILDSCDDKLETFRALAGKVPLVPFADGKDENAVREVVKKSAFPLVVKERRSSGSNGISVVRDEDQLQSALKKFEAPVVQAYIDDQVGEFSIGAFAIGSNLRKIIFNRKLGKVGASWWAENVENEAIGQYCEQVVKALDVQGSINIQVRVGAKGIFLLEINPRFSSLVAARAAAGFQDVEWSIALAHGETMAAFSEMSLKKIRFQRFIAEVIDRGGGFESPKEWALRR